MSTKTIKKVTFTCISLLMIISIISGCSFNKNETVNESTSSISDTSSTSSITESYNSLFKENNIVDVNLSISQSELNSMFTSGSTGEFHSADIYINNECVSNVGICIKGNMSYRTVSSSDSNRYSFAVDFGKYQADNNYYGLNSIVLNNNSGDPSFLKEYISYEMLKKINAPTPLCTFARLNINGEYFGLYTMVESPYNSGSFTQRIFGTNENTDMYEAGIGSSFASEESLKNITLTSGNSENSSDITSLYNTISNLNEDNYKSIENILDVDSFLKYVAGNVAFGSYDSYLSSQAQNYYLLHYNGKFYVIPWDYDKSFGGFEGDQGVSCAIKIDNPILDTTTNNLPLLKLISYPEYQEKYYSYLKELTNYLDNIENRINTLADLIRTDVTNDPTKLFTIEQFENELVYSDSQIDTSNITFPIESHKGNTPKISSNSSKGMTPPNKPNGKSFKPNGSEMTHSGNVSKVSLMTYAVKLRDNIKSQLS